MRMNDLCGMLGEDPRKLDGTPLTYAEQGAYVAGCLSAYFNLCHQGCVTLDEVAETMQIQRIHLTFLYSAWSAAKAENDM